MLNFTKGNAKLNKQTLIFNLPAGKTCPGALECKSWAVVDNNGKRTIRDGEHTQFRCFAASGEVQYSGAFNSRAENLGTIVENLRVGVDYTADQINVALQHFRTRNTELVRIHESGDFFNPLYLQAWNTVAKSNPDLKFYCYSKSLRIFQEFGVENLLDNFYLTASYGGVFDSMIDQGLFPRYAKVFKTEEDANAEGLEIDHDDSHCFGDEPFGLLVHNTQPKGSSWGAAIRARRSNKQFSGYSKKNTVTV
jgi:hypothetical protein